MTKVRNLIIVLGIAILTVTIARASSTSTTSRKNKCDVNWDSKVDISDITRYNGSCKAHDSNTPEWCDLNGDWNSDVSDDVAFQDKCMQIIAWFSVDDEEIEEEKEYDKCDLNKDSKIDNSDNVRFSNKCSSYSANGPKECDINGDWKYDISDRVKLSNCIAWVTDWNSTDEEEEDKNNTPNYSNELQEAYNWAYSEWIISESSIDNANLYDALTNLELADIMNNYCKNILRCSKDVSQSCTYLDIDDLSSKEKNIVEKSCQLWLMPWDLSSKYFNPYKTWTRATFGAALSRALRWDLYEWWSPYYKNHLNALKNAWIMTQINNPEDTPVIKWYVLITLKSIATGSDECTTCGTNQNTSTGTNKCDLNKDNTVDISDIVRYNNKCRAHESNSPKACDLNGDWKFDVSDDITFNDKCLNWEIAGHNSEKESTNTSTWTNKCDLNKDGKIDNSDNVRYSNKCGKFESNSPKACDLNGDWKFDVSDRVRFVNKCYTWELTWNSTESQKVNCDDPVVKLACNPESDECPEVCKSGNNSKKYPDLWALVYIKKQVNLWLTTQYTLWIIKDDEKMPVYNVWLFSSSDCVGSTLNTEPQKSLWEWWREYSDWEVIEAINMEKAQSINSIAYMYDQWKYVCISKKDYPDYFKVNGDSRKVYKYSTQNNQNNKYSDEMNNAYEFAYDNWITTINTIDKARMNGTLTRIEMAKMLSNYAINVLWKTPDTSKQCNFLDISNSLDAKYDYWVTKACQLGIMWQNVKNNKFRPYDTVTRAQFVSALSRMMYWINDGSWKVKYYEPHMSKLYNEWIISKKDPKMEEKRWNVMLMVYRASE